MCCVYVQLHLFDIIHFNASYNAIFSDENNAREISSKTNICLKWKVWLNFCGIPWFVFFFFNEKKNVKKKEKKKFVPCFYWIAHLFTIHSMCVFAENTTENQNANENT